MKKRKKLAPVEILKQIPVKFLTDAEKRKLEAAKEKVGQLSLF